MGRLPWTVGVGQCNHKGTSEEGMKIIIREGNVTTGAEVIERDLKVLYVPLAWKMENSGGLYKLRKGKEICSLLDPCQPIVDF